MIMHQRLQRALGGGIAVTLTGATLFATAGTALAAPATLTADQPAQALVNVGAQPVSPFVLADADVDGALTFTVTGAAKLSTANPVTVSVSSGDATVAATLDGAYGATASVVPAVAGTSSTVTVYVHGGSTPSTFTVSDLDASAQGTGLAKVTATDGTTTYGPVTATAAVVTERFGGVDRYATASKLFNDIAGCASTGNKGTNGDGTSTAVIARGDAFPDALAGNYLAGQLGTGILLVTPKIIPSGILASLKAAGVTDVIVVGGTSAISTAVTQQLASTPAYKCGGTKVGTLGVHRIGGKNRYQTAALAADAPGPQDVGTAAYDGKTTAARTAIVATGVDFPDALAAGPMSYWGSDRNGNNAGFPLLLTQSDALNRYAASELTTLGIKQVIVVGGTDAVSTTVRDAIAKKAIAVSPAAEFSGADRTDTAVKAARFETSATGLGYATSEMSLARADQFPDALAGGPWAGGLAEPILLITSPTALGAATAGYLGSLTAAKTTSLVAFGGTGAVSSGTLTAAANALTGD